MKPHIRWMIRRDMPRVLEILRNNGDEVTENEILALLRQKNCIGMVAEINEDIIGFMIYELKKQLIDVIYLMVDPIQNRLGYGGTLLNKLKGKLTAHRRSQLKILVRESNLCGQLFLRRYGCKATQVLREHYGDTNEDAYQFEFHHECTEPKSIVTVS